MRNALGIVVGAIIVAAAASLSAQPAGDRVPVVVELFTSEGCSSCPPADVVLSKLAQEQPVAGAQVITLGLHVTYWDQLGWKDPASLTDATARQQAYGQIFGEDHVYTPQAVIDGRDELVGSDGAGVTAAITRAAKRPHARVTLSARFQGDTVVASAAVSAVPSDVKEKLRTLFVITEDGLTSIVKRGENGGRTLHHDAVVRRISTAAEIPHLPTEWRRDRLHIIALVQGEKSQRIVAAAIAAIQ
jgi:hypothetical protein